MSKDTQLQKLGRLTVGEFFARFPDDDACLNHIMEVRYGLRHTCTGLRGLRHIPQAGGPPRVLMRALRPPRLSDSRDRLSGHAHAAASLVLRDLSVRHDAPRRERQGATARARCDLQNRVAHGPANPHAHGEGRRLRRTARATSKLMRRISAATARGKWPAAARTRPLCSASSNVAAARARWCRI